MCQKLNAPSFHFQLVKQAVRLALQRPEAKKKIPELLKYFNKTGLVSSDHMVKGFSVCRESINDIKLDVPNADKILAELEELGKSEGWLPK